MTRMAKVRRVVGEELGFDPRRVAAGLVSSSLPQNHFSRLRTMLLRALGLRIGATSLFAGPVHLTGAGPVGDLLSVGRGCYVTGPLHIDLSAPVHIGDRVYMGYEIMLLTVDHALGDSSQRCGPRVYRPIWIEDGVWIGSRATILPGVRLGRGSVVAAGAVVTRDVLPNTMVGGVPARLVRDLAHRATGDTRAERLAPVWSTAGDRR
jgi:maltose O-acetyltransferase